MGKVKKAIIPAAGLGTRFLPITKALPKPMLPVLDKPTIQYIIDELKSVGIEEIIVVISPGSEIIKQHFGPCDELMARLLADGKHELYQIAKDTYKPSVRFVVQHEANGLAGAILCAEEYVKDQPFALLLGDELLVTDNGKQSCISKLVEIYEQTGKSVMATMEVFGDDVSKYGNIGFDVDNNGIMEVNAIIEKPSINDALSNNAIIGRYVLSKKVMDYLKGLKPRGREIYFTDALDMLAKEGNLLASCIEDDRYDVGDKFGYIKANVEMALKSKEIGEETKEYLKNLVNLL